ncbi:MAG TPA: TonB-dependent receptor [Bacteroidia bacterium]|jgi:outer membrane receptor protein involved in Fe transport|nr:TonB-dependent receptor [Bacteroidia bacterium]
MIRNLLLFICSFFCTHNFFAQTVIKGKVSDKNTKETIPGVIVSGGNKTAITSVDGDFLLVTTPGKQIFMGSMAGYKTYRKEIELKENDTLVINIELELSNQMLDEVVISAGKYEQKLSDVTVSMEVIKPELLQSKCVAQLDQIMNQVPSVYVTDSQVSIRGGSGYSYGAGSRVMMLVDEMPMISADAGDIKWNYVPIENMEQVEVIKGASSALFGSSALNGVINMRTKYARDKPETQIISYTGIYGNPKEQAWAWWKKSNQSNPGYQGTTFSHAQKFGQLDAVFGGQLFNDDGYRQYANEQRVRANMNLRYNFKNIRGLSIGLNGTIMDDKGGLFFVWKNDSLALNPADSAGKPTSIQKYDNMKKNLDPYITYTNEKLGRFSLRTRTFVTDNHNDKNQDSRAILNYRELQWQKRFAGQLNVTSGLVEMEQKVISSSLYGYHNGRNIAMYVQADKRFFNRLTASVGARAEYYKVDTAETRGGFFFLKEAKKNNLPVQPVFRAGLNYQLLEYSFIRASFGQGYRFPSVAEKYISTYVSSLNLFPNPNLQPEKGWSAELGIKHGFKVSNFQGFVDVAGFVTHYYNMIDFVFEYDTIGKKAYIYSTPNPVAELLKHVGFQSRNIGRADITGVDISVTGTGKIGPVQVNLLTGYTYTNPINPDFNPKVDTNGTVISNVLRYRNKTLFKNDIQLTWHGFSVGWSTRFSSFMQNIDNRFEKPMIYDILNPNTSFYNSSFLYVLPGLKKYRQTHNQGNWVNDFRMSYQVSQHLKLSFLINNIFNVEFMSRPGYLEPQRTFIVQAAIKF